FRRVLFRSVTDVGKSVKCFSITILADGDRSLYVYINGNFRPFPFLPFCIFVMRFIIFFISLNCLSKRLTWDTDVPDPLAIRFLRLAFIIDGSWRSSLVIERMIAST